MAADIGLRAALQAQVSKEKPMEIVVPELANYAGAIGAALWAGHRVAKRPKNPDLETRHASV
jgi:activator of 2-hydroxyglutaryl-CoA dehydratase